MKKLCNNFAAFAFFILLSIGSTMSLAQEKSLSPFQWDYRPLVIFTPSIDDEAFLEQFEEINAHLPGFYDRDMLRVRVTKGTEKASLHARTLPNLTPDKIPETKTLYETYNVPADEFAVILVGKDGTEKIRWSEPVEMEDVFSKIDSMPMRKREMAEGK